MKGIVLAGGTGSRLWPITRSISKQLLPIYDKPLIYYPISTLMASGIREILVITTPDEQSLFKKVLGNGSDFGIDISFKIQEKPEGIAQAFLIAEDFISNSDVALILGDNLFYGAGLNNLLTQAKNNLGAHIFTYEVSNPQDYGVLNLKADGSPFSIVEKPTHPQSNLAITGLYFFDSSVVQFTKTISPSARGELEITSVMGKYLEENRLSFTELPNGTAWLDTGTPKSLQDAATFVRVIEERTGQKIACLEEIALRNGWLSPEDLLEIIQRYKNNDYGKYLIRLTKIKS